MELLLQVNYKLQKLAAYGAGLVICYMTFHIILEIILRIFGTSTYVLEEFIGYATSAITFLGLAYSMEKKSLVRVGLVIDRVKGFWKWLFEISCLIATLFISSMLLYYFVIRIFWRDIKRGTVSGSIAEIPLWIPESIAFFGICLFILQLIVMILLLLTEKLKLN